MWCPSATLAVWANSWLSGTAAPDDVLDALSLWAPAHSVTAYDAAAAARTGLPWPDVHDGGAIALLQTVRTAVGPRSATPPVLAVVLPVPGDARGLPPGTQFARDAMAAGEALLVADPASGEAVGLVPEFEYSDFEPDDFDGEDAGEPPEVTALSWTVYSLPVTPPPVHHDLGDAEYGLRTAVRSAAETLAALRASSGGVDVADPRGLVEQVLESGRHHRAPDTAPDRAVRVLDNAARVDAIVTVSSGLMPIGLPSSFDAALAGDALRPLAAVVRSARLAAVSEILHSAWRG
ncbi:hypothetical protein LV457_14795 [Mycobacterium sp. MYCO198283]|uniref:hypothetical protein n=1 Tax=Mycobacterium sp. MYCO198283 TaxID=2883505 RepID=UPI001E2B1D8E|nr:hypothetical protein [Mycobacterium sp. MYCO198283]MCG5433546.1 hypothetical protein [Mycobacterium sp. MYCO198283]